MLGATTLLITSLVSLVLVLIGQGVLGMGGGRVV
jgi:hypothetical protein